MKLRRGARIAALTVMLAALFLAGMAVSAQAWQGVHNFEGETVRINYMHAFPESLPPGHQERIEDMFNVKIELFEWREWIPGGETPVSVVAAGVLADDPPVDIMVLSDNYVRELASEGLLYPLDDILDEDYWNSLAPTQAPYREMGKWEGQQVATAVGGEHGRAEDLDSWMQYVFWNKDLFEREGLPNIYELQDAGEWTWETFLDIAQRATRDTTGDGEIDQWGLVSRHGLDHSTVAARKTASFAVANNGHLVREENGRIVATIDDEPYLEALQYVHDLVNVYEVTPKSDVYAEVGGAAPGVDIFGEGRAAMALYHWWGWFVRDYDAVDEVGLAFVPMGPNGDRLKGIPIAGGRMMMLPINTRYEPEALIALANAYKELTSEWRDMDFYMDEVLDEVVVHDRESLRIVEAMMVDFEDIGWYLDLLKVEAFPQAINQVMAGELTPTVAMEGAKPEVQAYFDDVYN